MSSPPSSSAASGSGSSSGSSSRSPGTDHPRTHHDHRDHRDREHDPRSSSSSSSSSKSELESSSASSSTTPDAPAGTTRPHHLLPPLAPPSPGSGSSSGRGDKPGGPIFANEILDPELLGLSPHAHSPGHVHKPNPVPEKCLTFCTQSQDRQPLCRMFCLRRRRPVASQKEELARLRPSDASHQHAATATAAKAGNTDTDRWRWWDVNPFKAMERTVAPWSFVYVKGTVEGPVGRYMEEMEGDDGYRDFGSISRSANDLARRRGEVGWEYLDWGEHGSLLHLPFTSLLYPIISFPQTLERVFAPSLRLLKLYRTSFTDGAQERNLAKIRTEVETGGAFKLFDKLESHYRKKVGERRVEIEKQMEERQRQKEVMVQKRKEEVEREVGKFQETGGDGQGRS